MAWKDGFDDYRPQGSLLVYFRQIRQKVASNIIPNPTPLKKQRYFEVLAGHFFDFFLLFF
jgi:hypothetical protein